MVIHIVKKDESIDKAIRKFEMKCRRAKVYQLVLQKSYYISKSEKRHRKKSRRRRTSYHDSEN